MNEKAIFIENKLDFCVTLLSQGLGKIKAKKGR
jgi:hypothetical protein